MRVRAMAAVVLALPLLALPATPASAHPLGNFSVNRYSRIEVAPDRVTLRYVLDLAEIPTLQDLAAAGVPADAPEETVSRAILAPRAERIGSNLHLLLDGAAATFRLADASLALPEGQAGLRTMRIALTLIAPLRVRDGMTIDYRDGNEAGRSGWHEVVLRGVDGVAMGESTVLDRDRSDELRRYPDDPTASPPNDDHAAARLRIGGAVSTATSALAPAATTTRFAIDRTADQLTGFLRRGPGTDLGALLAALAVAAFLGALHALGPGHGKAIVGAYLVGSRGTPLHAVLLGGTVTATHTAGVYALALLTLLAAPYVLPERLYPILGVASGLLVVAIGLSLAWSRMRRLRAHGHDRHGHAHGHEHDHAHGHDHAAGGASLRSVLALGVSGGVLPCPTALVVLLAAISFHNAALGMALVAAFSAGLATVLTGIGLLMVGGGRALARSRAAATLGSWRLVRAVPVLSAVAVAVAGVVIAFDAARALG